MIKTIVYELIFHTHQQYRPALLNLDASAKGCSLMTHASTCQASAHFEQPSRAHATADAHGDHDILHATAAAFNQRMPHQP